MPSTLHRTSTPQLVKASGTAADPYILENMDIGVRTLSNAGLTLLNAQHILVRNVRIRHAPHAVGIQLINSHRRRRRGPERSGGRGERCSRMVERDRRVRVINF